MASSSRPDSFTLLQQLRKHNCSWWKRPIRESKGAESHRMSLRHQKHTALFSPNCTDAQHKPLHAVDSRRPRASSTADACWNCSWKEVPQGFDSNVSTAGMFGLWVDQSLSLPRALNINLCDKEPVLNFDFLMQLLQRRLNSLSEAPC